MDDIKQKLNRAHELLSGVQIAGAYAKRFGAAMLEIENAYAGVEKAERELITLRNQLAESEKEARKTGTAKSPKEKEATDGRQSDK